MPHRSGSEQRHHAQGCPALHTHHPERAHPPPPDSPLRPPITASSATRRSKPPSRPCRTCDSTGGTGGSQRVSEHEPHDGPLPGLPNRRKQARLVCGCAPPRGPSSRAGPARAPRHHSLGRPLRSHRRPARRSMLLDSLARFWMRCSWWKSFEFKLPRSSGTSFCRRCEK